MCQFLFHSCSSSFLIILGVRNKYKRIGTQGPKSTRNHPIDPSISFIFYNQQPRKPVLGRDPRSQTISFVFSRMQNIHKSLLGSPGIVIEGGKEVFPLNKVRENTLNLQFMVQSTSQTISVAIPRTSYLIENNNKIIKMDSVPFKVSGYHLVPDHVYGFDYAAYKPNQEGKHTHSVALVKRVEGESMRDLEGWLRVCQGVKKELWLLRDDQVYPVSLGQL